jgi:hypothetical protein
MLGRVAAFARAGAWMMVLPFAIAPAAGGADAGHASGSASFDKHAATFTFGWLVGAPDPFGHGKNIRRIYFASSDVGAKIAACDSLDCADALLVNGAFVDYGDPSYNAYWMTLNDGRVQYSGGADSAAFTLSTNQRDHLAGKVRIDDSGFGGGKLTAEFDLPLLKTFKK